MNENALVNEDTDKYKFTCIECKVVTKTMTEMELHVKTKHESTVETEMCFLCTLCSHKFCSQSELTSHIESTHNQKYLEADDFTSERNNANHRKDEDVSVLLSVSPSITLDRNEEDTLGNDISKKPELDENVAVSEVCDKSSIESEILEDHNESIHDVTCAQLSVATRSIYILLKSLYPTNFRR